jgi:hypothetical protein
VEYPSDIKRLATSSDECIRRVVIEQLWGSDRFNPIFAYLEEILTALGMQFYSPGGSVQRRVCILLAELFGVGVTPEYVKYAKNPAVRVGLDLLADEIVRRRGAGAEEFGLGCHDCPRSPSAYRLHKPAVCRGLWWAEIGRGLMFLLVGGWRRIY